MVSQEWFDQLQQQYPFPIPCPVDARGKPDLYCVAGAFLRFRHGGKALGFPGSIETAEEILLINHSLSFEQAYDIVDRIIKVNDNGEIVLAWQLLQDVICAPCPLADDSCI